MKKQIIPLVSILILFFAWAVQAGSLEPWVYLPLVNRAPNTPTPTPSPTITKTATPIPATFTPTPTKTATPTATQPQIADVNIINIQPEGSEYVEIRNDGNGSAQLLNWTLSDEANHVYTFPDYNIQPGQTCRVYTDENHPEWCGFNYNSGSPIWNNTGDCGTLRTNDGTLVDQYCYP